MSPRHPRPALPQCARPMLVAHRGASSLAAEHTLAAYEAAIASGADALECDVRLTRDGHLVCVHDRTVNRTSNGQGVVSALDLQSLDSLDFSSWYAAAHQDPDSADALVPDSPYLAGVAPDRIERGGGVLTLDRLLQLVHDADRHVRLLIETKHPTRYGGLVEKTLVDALARFGWTGTLPATLPIDPTTIPPDLGNRVVVMSFAATAVRRIRLLAPAIPTVLLLERFLPPKRAAAKLPAGTPIAGPGLHLLRTDPQFVERAHARGVRVFVWTVNAPADVEFVLDLGVDTIITDRPAEVRALLARRADKGPANR